MTKTAKAPVTGDAKSPRLAVTETNLRRAAKRLLPSALVSTEISWIQHVLGATATESEIDAKVVAVRSMPWSSIVLPE